MAGVVSCLGQTTLRRYRGVVCQQGLPPNRPSERAMGALTACLYTMPLQDSEPLLLVWSMLWVLGCWKHSGLEVFGGRRRRRSSPFDMELL